VAWARVPLQVPLLVSAWRHTRLTSTDAVAGAGQRRR
jgi:hypothetical protein